MKVLVIGSGGREHAITWRLKHSPSVSKVYCAPGNPGIGTVADCVNIGVMEFDKLLDFAREHQIDLTVVGPEVPLCAGITDFFKAAGMKVFGPSKAAAALEGSKHAAKEFMKKYNLPAAESETFYDAKSAREYVLRQFVSGKTSVVVKADGLAAGKGVVVAGSCAEALAAVEACFAGAFGEAGHCVVIEECLFGLETSVLALTDGTAIVPLASSQDHKCLEDGDKGPNTGGMGTCSPSPGFTPQLRTVIRQTILEPFLDGIREEGYDYKGIIFIGLMLTASGPKLLEFNVRFGDPETQVILPRLEGDFGEICRLTAEGRLSEAELSWSEKSSVCVVMAAGGYPETYRKGDVICGLGAADELGVTVFHAGTAFNEQGDVVTAGGRVLGVTALEDDMQTAIEKAYAAVKVIAWPDCTFRHDIGQKCFLD